MKTTTYTEHFAPDDHTSWGFEGRFNDPSLAWGRNDLDSRDIDLSEHIVLEVQNGLVQATVTHVPFYEGVEELSPAEQETYADGEYTVADTYIFQGDISSLRLDRFRTIDYDISKRAAEASFTEQLEIDGKVYTVEMFFHMD